MSGVESTASASQSAPNAVIAFAKMLRDAESTPSSSSVQLRNDIVDKIYDCLIQIDDPATLAASCRELVTAGLPGDVKRADEIIGELLHRFEISKSEMLDALGAFLLENVAKRYNAGFSSLRDFEDAATPLDKLGTQEFRNEVDKIMASYDAAVTPFKKEFQEFAKSLGKELTDEALSRLSFSEIEELCGNYMHEGYDTYSKESNALYKRLMSGTKKEADAALDQLIAPNIYHERVDKHSSILMRCLVVMGDSARVIAKLVKESPNVREAILKLSYALSKMGKDFNLSLELLSQLTKDEVGGYWIFEIHVNELTSILKSGNVAKVFSVQRKLRRALSSLFG